MDLQKLMDAQNLIAQRIAAKVAGLEWREIAVQYRGLALVGEADAMAVTLADGSIARIAMPADALYELGQLRRDHMVQPDKGTWYAADVRLEYPNTLHIDFDYHTAPSWNIARDSEDYLEDQALYPRSQEHLPPWHPARRDDGPEDGSTRPRL